MLFYRKEIDNWLTSWLNMHGFSCAATMDTHFSCDKENNLITYSFFVPQQHAELFIHYCRELRPQLIACDNFILSLFHELGHLATHNEFTKQQLNQYDKFLTKLWDKYEEDSLDISERMCYYNCEVERRATEWGLDYILNNQQEIVQFSKELVKNEQMFLEKNNYLP